MKFKHILNHVETWWVPVSIPARDMSDLLLLVDKAKYLQFDILIQVDVTPTIEGGIFEYTGEWSLPLIGNYPRRVLDAIDMHLGRIRVIDTFMDAIRKMK